MLDQENQLYDGGELSNYKNEDNEASDPEKNKESVEIIIQNQFELPNEEKGQENHCSSLIDQNNRNQENGEERISDQNSLNQNNKLNISIEENNQENKIILKIPLFIMDHPRTKQQKISSSDTDENYEIYKYDQLNKQTILIKINNLPNFIHKHDKIINFISY